MAAQQSGRTQKIRRDGQMIARDGAQGRVPDGSGESLFGVRDPERQTAALAHGVLDGRTRESVSTIARDLGYDVRAQAMPGQGFCSAGEPFFTGAATEVTPIRSSDRLTPVVDPVGAAR